MAPLTRYYQKPTVDVDLLSPAAADQGTDAIGAGLKSFGQSIDNINERDDDFWVQKTLADADSTANEQWTGAVQSATDGAPNFRAGFEGNIQKQHDQYLQGAPSGRAQKQLEIGLQRQKNQWTQKAVGFESQERTSYKVREITRQADNLGQEAMREPGVEPYSPQGRIIPPGTVDATARPDAEGYYTNSHVEEKTGAALSDNLSEFQSAYYKPQDFADGRNIQDKSGAIKVSKRMVGALDWVTDQFGMGKLQINSAYRSPSSNLARASSGEDGPHTHGEAIDVQVGDLPQEKKNQLYSLFKAQGFNAFGFGSGVLHAEIRPGKGNGRGGDFEWQYGSQPKYSPVAVSTFNEIPENKEGTREGLRPFTPNERRTNGDGTYSTEISTTWQLPGGEWVNVPSLWNSDKGWVQFEDGDEDGIMGAMSDFEKKNGPTFARFTSEEEAVKASEERSSNGGAGSGPAWKSPNQYPQIDAATITSSLETGKTNMVEASAQIAADSKGTKSYGMFGINSGGTMQSFIDSNQDLGLTASPGTPEFDQQWTNLVQKSPQKVVDAQLRFHQQKIVQPAQRSLVVAGLGKFSNDPRAVAFVSDMVVQYGAGGVEKHLLAAAGSQNISEFVQSASDSMRSSIDYDFRSALDRDPSQRAGLLNRIDRRSKDSTALGSGGGNQPITGNVPAWNGPIPDINNVPGFQERRARIDAMVDTMGGSPEDRRQVRDQMNRTITRSWLSSLAETNPSAAMAALHSGKYDDALTVGDDAAISGGAEAGWKSYESEIRTAHKQLLTNLQTEAHAALSDEVASLSTTGKSLGGLSDAHRAMLTDDDKEKLGLAKFQYDIGQKVSTATAGELPAILDNLKPQGDGFATEQKKYDYAAELIAARQKRQATDPAGYAVSSSKQISELWQKAIASGDPATVQSAINTIRRTQQAQGVPSSQIRSITQTSEENNGKLLDGAPDADTAFARFTELRRQYGGESAAVFSEMERDGGTKGWSAVNELMDGGNVVLAKSLSRVVQAKGFKGDAQIGLRLARAGDTATARAIFDGRVRRETVKGLEPAGNSEEDQSVNQVLGEALGDALDLSPQVLDDVREASKSFVANGAALGEKWQAEKLVDAANKVTGGILEHNGDGRTGKMVAPMAGMDQKAFDKALLGLKDSDLKGAFIGSSTVPAPVTADMVRDKLQFVSIGNGRYSLRYPNAGLARDEKGLPFELNLGDMLPTLTKRGDERVTKQKADDAAALAEQMATETGQGLPSMHDFLFGSSGKTLKDALTIETGRGKSK